MSPYTEHAESGLPNPTHLEVGVRFVQAQDQHVVSDTEFRRRYNTKTSGERDNVGIWWYCQGQLSIFLHKTYFVGTH